MENDEIYDDDDEWLVFMQLNKINPLLDELIDHVWLTIYNKNREKNEIINIDIDKHKDIEGYVKIYKKIIDDKFEFVNKIVELYNNAIDKKEFNNLKDDVLKLIGTNSICDVERKVSEKDNNNNNNNNNNNQQDNVTYNMGEIKSITFQFNISIFELSEVTASIIKYTSILITVCKN